MDTPFKPLYASSSTAESCGSTARRRTAETDNKEAVSALRNLKVPAESKFRFVTLSLQLMQPNTFNKHTGLVFAQGSKI